MFLWKQLEEMDQVKLLSLSKDQCHGMLQNLMLNMLVISMHEILKELLFGSFCLLGWNILFE